MIPSFSSLGLYGIPANEPFMVGHGLIHYSLKRG
jgi:hypothetical protein